MTVFAKRPAVNKGMRLSTKENLAGWAFISLNFAGYVLFKLIPLLIAAGLSFSKWNFASSIKNLKFVGFSNYAKIGRAHV